MIDPNSEHLLTSAEATKVFPGNPHISTLIRHMLKGLGGIRLESLVAGGRRFTSREAILRFIVATTLKRDPRHPSERANGGVAGPTTMAGDGPVPRSNGSIELALDRAGLWPTEHAKRQGGGERPIE